MKKFILGILFLFVFAKTKAQSLNQYLAEPEIGKPCPYFFFDKIDFYKSKRLSLQHLKGKWVVLDFWSRFCSGCIASFPKISKEQKQFGDSVQFIMVTWDSTTGERELYKNYYQKLHLTMPSAYDNDLIRSFNVGSLPHIIIIDPSGKVRAITVKIDSSKLRELMNGGNPTFMPATYANEKQPIKTYKYDYKAPYLLYGNGGIDSNFLFRSILTQWIPGNPNVGNHSMLESKQYVKNSGRFELIGYPIDVLYMAAYLGKTGIGRFDTSLYGNFFPKPIFEISDMSVLQYDFATGKNLYCYSMIVPAAKATDYFMMRTMQNDLKNYFGYEVSIETRKMPYWKLIASNDAKMKLRTKGGNAIVSDNGKPLQETSLRNYPISKFMYLVGSFSRISDLPILDETGITFNIDIDLDWIKDFEVCRQALKKNGLDLVRAEKQMKCIIIKDTKPEKGE